MKPRRLWIWAGALFLAAILAGTALAHTRRNTPSSKTWLSLSAPVFSLATNEAGPRVTVTITVSNNGPQDIAGFLSWIDCRSEAEPAWRTPVGRAAPGIVRVVQGSTISLTLPVDSGTLKPSLFCCCGFQWQEQPSFLRRAILNWVDPGLVWLQNCFQPDWRPYTWSLAARLNPTIGGFAFSANTTVDDYFKRFYGLDRATWVSDFARQRALGQTNPMNPVVVPITNEQSFEANQARQAFGQYLLTPK